MKKKNLLLSVVLFFSILPMTLFAGCDKDTNCYLTIKVVDSITKIPIPQATVEIYQEGGGTVHAEGLTANDGSFSVQFVAPAIVQVLARLDVYGEGGVRVGERRATGSVRLVEGETVSTQLLMTEQIFY